MARKYEWKHNYAVLWFDDRDRRISYVNGLTAKESRYFYERQRCDRRIKWIARVQVNKSTHAIPPITDYEKAILGFE